MGFFSNLFGKKEQKPVPKDDPYTQAMQMEPGDTLISSGGNTGYKALRELTDEQRQKIEQSTLQLMASQLYMHYYTPNLVCNNPDDPDWQNKVMFFWKAEEPFPKKSLPPEFETYLEKTFVFTGDTSDISVNVGKAMPWFGQPGLGEKFFCERNAQKITVPELHDLGIVEYLEPVELTDRNLNILTNMGEYFFLVDDRITPFREGNFYLDGRPISIDMAYSIGGIHLVKKVELN